MSETRRKLRARAERRQYKDLPDDEIEEVPSFSLNEKLECPRFEEVNLVKEMKGEDLNFKFLQENSFDDPILVREQKGLNMKVPDFKSFYVKDVERFVGSDRLLDVMDVKTQKNLEMTLKEWCDYFMNPAKSKLLNVISLEFSHTELANYVEPPLVIKQLDWVNCVWPRYLKLLQKESTNAIEEMKYPKVQKYCLMSVKGCFTDFHIDFGGTSVWYHILKGKKVFWLIPPTPLNMELYEQWVLSGKQSNLFFGDTVEHCSRVFLKGGDTFFIPSGWIHAVYTPEDSLVFGGNFLHSIAIESQIKIAQLENLTKVPIKFRYPFFIEIHWYVLSNYIECLTGKCFLTINNDGEPIENEGTSESDNNDKRQKFFTKSKWNLNFENVYLEDYESTGLKLIVKYLSKFSKNKNSIPNLITNSTALMNEAKQVISNIKNYDKSKKSSSSQAVLYWLSKINFEPAFNQENLNIKPSKDQSLTSPLKSWGAGLQNVNSKFIAFQNKINTEADNNNTTCKKKLAKLDLGKQKDFKNASSKLEKNKQFITETSSNNQTETSENNDAMPNSFEKLIAATDINSNNQTQSLSSNNLPTNNVNNVYLSHPTSNQTNCKINNSIKTTVVPANTIYTTNSGIIMNRPIYNSSIVTGTPPGLICTNSAGLQPNLYPIQQGMSIDPMSIRNNFNNYNLISNAAMLTTTPTGLGVIATDLPVLNSQNNSKQFESHQANSMNKNQLFINKRLDYGPWYQMQQQQQHLQQPQMQPQMQQPMPISQQQMMNSLNINNSSLNLKKSSKNSSNKNLSKQQTQAIIPPINQSIPQQQMSLNNQFPNQILNQSTGQSLAQLPKGQIISNQPHNLQLANTTSQHHPSQQPSFLSTYPQNKTPINNAFVRDPNCPGSVINFTGQPTGFITPTINTNLAHPLNQNFIITPVSSNILTGNNLIQNQIYPNFISNVIPGNMLVNTSINPTMPITPGHGNLISQSSINSFNQQPNPNIIGKPSNKIQRINCRKCIPCTRNSCGLCTPCLDYYSKFGQFPLANNLSYGGQVNSEICLTKKCLNPILPYNAICCLCGKNGWHNLVINSSDQHQIMQLDSNCDLLECDTCNQIVHSECVRFNLPQKTLEGRTNNHLVNSWTCPICVTVKDKELAKLEIKNKQINSNKEIINNQNYVKNNTKIEESNKMTDKQKQSELKSNEIVKPKFVKTSDLLMKNKKINNSNTNKNEFETKKEVYDFDAEEDENEEESLVLTKSEKNKKFQKFKKADCDIFQKRKEYQKSINNSTPKSSHLDDLSKNADHSNYEDKKSTIKLPPKKMAKKLNSNQTDNNTNKYQLEEEENKLLLLATTSCQKSQIEKQDTPVKHLNDQKSDNDNERKMKKKKQSKESDSDKSCNEQIKNKSLNNSNSQKSKIPLPNNNIQGNIKSRNKQLQSTRGRLEQTLKVLKKKADSKNFNFAFRKFNLQSQVKTNLPNNKVGTTCSSSSTTNVNVNTNSSTLLNSSQPNSVQTSNQNNNQAVSVTNTSINSNLSQQNKETKVANCLKNDSVLYPNNNKDNKDALLNKFRNLASTSIDCQQNKEDSFGNSSDSSSGKLEILTFPETSINNSIISNDKLQKPEKLNTNDYLNDKEESQVSKDESINSTINSNKNLYECETNSAKLIPMSYSIEKLASSTSIINKPLEPAPPSSIFNTFKKGIDNDSDDSKFNSKFKKQNDLFPNLNRYTNSFSNWSNAFKQNQEKQSISSNFNFNPSTSVFGAFTRNMQTNSNSLINTSQSNTNMLNEITENSVCKTNLDNSPKKMHSDSINNKNESANVLDEINYYTSTEDEDEETIANTSFQKSIKDVTLTSKNDDEETDIETDIDSENEEQINLKLEINKVLTEQLMSEDEDDYKEELPETPAAKKIAKSKNTPKTSNAKAKKKNNLKKVEKTKKGKVVKNSIKDTPKNMKKVKKDKINKNSNKQAISINEDSDELEENIEEMDEELHLSNLTKKNSASKNKSSIRKKQSQLQVANKNQITNNKRKLIEDKNIVQSQIKNKKARKIKTKAIKNDGKRKTEVDRLLDETKIDSDLVEEIVYETIADKVKRNLGRKSKVVVPSSSSTPSSPIKKTNSISKSKQKLDKVLSKNLKSSTNSPNKRKNLSTKTSKKLKKNVEKTDSDTTKDDSLEISQDEDIFEDSKKKSKNQFNSSGSDFESLKKKKSKDIKNESNLSNKKKSGKLKSNK